MWKIVALLFSFLFILNCSTNKLKQNSSKSLSISKVEIEPYVGGREGVKGKIYRIYTTKIADGVVLNKLYIENEWLNITQDQTDENLFLAYSKEIIKSNEESEEFETIGEEERALDITIIKPDYSTKDNFRDKVILDYSTKAKKKQIEITNIETKKTAFYP